MSAGTEKDGAGRRRGGRSLWTDGSFLLEAFVAANLLFLVVDVRLAHAFNDFAHATEWIPIGYAAPAGLAVILGLVLGVRRGERRGWLHGFGRAAGLAAGWAGVLVGTVGLVLHLEGHFFRVLTLRGLVYSAPFVAPLSFAGLGFLLLMNRMVDPDDGRWSGWVLLLALGGFTGNFLLSLIDHAQNGFFFAIEWVPVAAAAVATGYLAVLFVREPEEGYLRLGYWVMGLQAAVGIVGFALHGARLLEASGTSPLAERVVHGAPLFAPLLFVDLAALAVLGLRDLRGKRTRAGAGDRGDRRPPTGKPGDGGAGAGPGKRAPAGGGGPRR